MNNGMNGMGQMATTIMSMGPGNNMPGMQSQQPMMGHHNTLAMGNTNTMINGGPMHGAGGGQMNARGVGNTNVGPMMANSGVGNGMMNGGASVVGVAGGPQGMMNGSKHGILSQQQQQQAMMDQNMYNTNGFNNAGGPTAGGPRGGRPSPYPSPQQYVAQKRSYNNYNTGPGPGSMQAYGQLSQQQTQYNHTNQVSYI